MERKKVLGCSEFRKGTEKGKGVTKSLNFLNGLYRFMAKLRFLQSYGFYRITGHLPVIS